MIKSDLNNIPKSSGIYFWMDNKGKVLYVGRATNLKNRLSQYFLSNVEPRIREMVSLSKKVKFIQTDTLLEAIILEAKHIKKHWPKYNIRDRDDRSFVYIIILKKDFSHPLIVRGKDLSKYENVEKDIFGPYQSFTLIKNALRIIRRIFPYSTCKPGSKKACFDYQIGLCPGVCIELADKKEYKKNINNIKLLLDGKKELLIKRLIKENNNQAKALKHLQDVSLLEKDNNITNVNFKRIEAYDISHFSGKEAYGSMVVFDSMGNSIKDEYRLFKIKNNFLNDDLRALSEVIERRLNHEEWSYPDLFLIDGGKPQLHFLKDIFEKYKIKNVVGLSKFSGDKLVFLSNVDLKFKKSAEEAKDILLSARDEAHRFANSARKRAKKI
ncbi:MAG: GIY-YIG nuclease family protein [Patescibacteria group bacterium]